MDPLTAQQVIERLLASDQVTAGRWLQQNAAQLDDTFFAVVNGMLQQAQTAYEDAWGSSFEDRLALGVARVQSGGGANPRATGLTAIRDYGWLMRLLAQASPDGCAHPMTVSCPICGQTHPMICPGMNRHPPAPSVLAPANALPVCVVCGTRFDHATCSCGNVIRFSPHEAPPPDPRIAETRRSLRDGELRQRLLRARESALPGVAKPAVVAEIEAIQGEYHALVAEAEAAPPGKLTTLDEFRLRLADCDDALARAHEALRDEAKAAVCYERAAAAFDQLGQPAAAASCRESLTAMRNFTGGNVDDEMMRLRAALEAAPADSVTRAQRLVELGELHGRNGDDFAAREFYEQALAALTAQGHARDGRPVGTMLDAMRATLTGISEVKPGGSRVEVFVAVRGMLLRLHIGLARVFKTTDAAKSAQHLTLADQLDGRDDGTAMEEARKAMADLQQQMAALAGKIAQ